MAVGMAMMASRLGCLVIIVGVTVLHLRLMGREEMELAASQGERFRAFSSAVPRFLPSLAPRLPASGSKPRWGQAFLGEAFFWGFAAAAIVFAATGNMRLTIAVVLASLAVNILLGFVWRWERAKRA